MVPHSDLSRKRDENGTLVVVPEEAAVVRRICPWVVGKNYFRGYIQLDVDDPEIVSEYVTAVYGE